MLRLRYGLGADDGRFAKQEGGEVIIDVSQHRGACLLALLVLALWPDAGRAACVIENSPCYPWRIGQGEKETEILKVVPNNAVTSAIYRVCLCPPEKSVSVVFDFYSRVVEIGAVRVDGGGPMCRDFRIETSRRSRLLVRRAAEDKRVVEGCYAAAPTLP